MAWVLAESGAQFMAVHFEMAPACRELRPSYSYFEERGLSTTDIALTGLPVEDRYWPKAARLKTARGALPHWVGFCSFPGYSQAWVDEIEALEPRRHEFRRVQLLGKDGSPRDEVYYAANIRTILNNVVDFEKTTARVNHFPAGPKVAGLAECDSGKVVLRADRIRPYHHWYCGDLSNHARMVSNELYERLASRKLLTGLLQIEAKEI
jgi:hypothetical protein